MAVFKRLTCTRHGCRVRKHVKEEKRRPPRCVVCGSQTKYSDKWYISYVDPEGYSRTRAVSEDRDIAVAKEVGMRLSGKARLSGTIPKNTIINVGDAVHGYLRDCQKRVDNGQLSKKTLFAYRSRLQHLLAVKHTLHIYAARVRFEVNQDNARDMGRMTTSSINRRTTAIKQFFKWCVDKEILEKNPLENYEMLPETRGRNRVITYEQYCKIVCHAEDAHNNQALGTAIRIAWNTGLRRNNVLSLKWSDIDFDANTIRAVVKHRRANGPKEVSIPISNPLRGHLQKLYNERVSEYVIPSPKNPDKPINVSSDMGFKKVCQEVGIDDFKFHDLRHCFATYFLSRTKNLPLLADILGHSVAEQYRMSLRYAHVLEGDKQEAMEAFSKLGG
jgi:integrase